MRRLLPIFLLLALPCTFPACASKKEAPQNPYASTTPKPSKPSLLQVCLNKISSIFPKKKKPPVAMPPQWTGQIRMVNSAENFVLIESSAISTAIPGEIYLAVGKGVETASLKMTSLKNPPFLIADILSGTPSAGDKIYLPKSSASPQTPEPKPTPKSKPTPKAPVKSPPKPSPAPAPVTSSAS